MKMSNEFYLLIAGSRGFGMYDSFECFGEILPATTICETIATAMLKKQLELGREIHIVQGDARGADTVGKDFGNCHGYTVHSFPAKWGTYGRSAGYIRNAEMYDFIHAKENRGALLFWDGTSRGTRNNFYQGLKRDIPMKCFNYLEQRFLSFEEMYNIYVEVMNEQG